MTNIRLPLIGQSHWTFMRPIQHVLDWRIPYYWWEDVGRLLAIGLALYIFYTVMHRAGRLATIAGRRRHAIAMFWSLVVIIQELDALGRPFLLWRMPLFVVGSLYIIRNLRHAFVMVREGDPDGSVGSARPSPG